MKVHMKNPCFCLRGKLDGLVFYKHPKIDANLARKYKPCKPNSSHERFSAIQRNLGRIQPSAGFVNDCKTYVFLFNLRRETQGRKLCSWTNVFFKMMYGLRRLDPEIDLETITREEIIDEHLPVRSVRDAIEAGILEYVKGGELLESVI